LALGGGWGGGGGEGRRGVAGGTDHGELFPFSIRSPDPLLNRGAVLEQVGRLAEAERDYESVLKAYPKDPAGHNNVGNVRMARGDFSGARAAYDEAARISPDFASARASGAEALWAGAKATGDGDASAEADLARAERELRQLLRKYPGFDDARAALAAALWARGSEAEAEEAWSRVDDPRYRDVGWLRDDRRWPGPLVDALSGLIDIRSGV